MKVKTAELTGTALDWAVAKCIGLLEPMHGEPQPRVVLFNDAPYDRYMRLNPRPQPYYSDRYSPSTDHSQGHSIIEDYKISVGNQEHLNVPPGSEWYATDRQGNYGFATTALEAVCRCLVHQELGAEVEIPEELLAAR